MPAFVLLPCKIRQNKFVPQKGAETIDLDLEDVLAKFEIDKKSRFDTIRIKCLRPGAFIGKTVSSKGDRNICFVLYNDGMSCDFGWILDKNPTFPDRVLEVYRVERTAWEGSMEEMVA